MNFSIVLSPVAYELMKAKSIYPLVEIDWQVSRFRDGSALGTLD